MQDTYEVVVTQAGKTMFQEAFYNYMTLLGFAHMSIGGRLGGLTSYDFTSEEFTKHTPLYTPLVLKISEISIWRLLCRPKRCWMIPGWFPDYF